MEKIFPSIETITKAIWTHSHPCSLYFLCLLAYCLKPHVSTWSQEGRITTVLYRNTETIALEDHPTPLEVEKRRHRKAKWLMDSGTFQGEKELRVKNTHTFLPGSCSGPNILLILLGTLEIDSSFKCQVMFSSRTCCIAKQVGSVQENKAREIPSPISQLLFLLIFQLFKYTMEVSASGQMWREKNHQPKAVWKSIPSTTVQQKWGIQKSEVFVQLEQFSAILMGPGSIFSPRSQVKGVLMIKSCRPCQGRRSLAPTKESCLGCGPWVSGTRRFLLNGWRTSLGSGIVTKNTFRPSFPQSCKHLYKVFFSVQFLPWPQVTKKSSPSLQ